MLISCSSGVLSRYAETQQLKPACEMASQVLKELHPGLQNEPAKQVDLPYIVQDAFFHMISRSGLQVRCTLLLPPSLPPSLSFSPRESHPTDDVLCPLCPLSSPVCTGFSLNAHLQPVGRR